MFLLRERMNRFFEEAHLESGRAGSAVWVPVVDIYETPAEFVVNAELPEVSEQDISIKLEGTVLEISGERKLHREGRSYHQVERAYGTFSRTFVLPADVDREAIEASLKDGVLRVVIPKRAGEPARRIEIQ